MRSDRLGRSERGRSSGFAGSWRILGFLLVLGAGLGGAGCSDPDRAILARLDEAGQARFRSGRAIATPCWTCHDLAGTVKKVGPSLVGIYGRRSGWAPDYKASPALLDANIVWNDRSLAAFLRDPAGFVPGNTMVSQGVQDSTALADLLFYLRHVTYPQAREAQLL
jgi:cytochrome c